MKKAILFCLFVCNFFICFSQIVITSSVQPEILVCGNSEIYAVTVLNNTIDTIKNASVKVELPQGVKYILGSANEATAQNLQEFNTTNVEQPIFSINDILPSDSLKFTINIAAKTSSIAWQQAGNVFRNLVILNHLTGADSLYSSAYNILFPSLNITSVSPSAQIVINGDTITRSFTIVNAGYGKASQILVSHAMNNTGLALITATFGVFNSVKDTLILSAIDFSQIGNGDNYFDYGETIIVSQRLVSTGCSEHTVTSTIKAHWGCEGSLITTLPSYTNATIQLKNPALNVTSTGTITSCFGSDSSAYSLTLINSGQGFAKNVAIKINKLNNNILSAIDPQTFTISYNGGTLQSVVPTTTATIDTGAYTCLGVNPVGQIDYILPGGLSAGDTCVINFKIFQCCINNCSGVGNTGWEYQVNYDNYCQTISYNNTGTPENTTQLSLNVFTETPSDIYNGEKLSFIYSISSISNTLPQGQGAHYELTFLLDSELTITNINTDLIFSSNNTVWTPFSINYNTSSNQLIAKYALPNPFTLTNAEIKLQITGNCSNSSSGAVKNTTLNISYIADTTCNAGCKVEMLCSNTTAVELHCYVASCEGLYMTKFIAERTSFGLPDNNGDGLPDTAGALNLTKIKKRRLMVNDTLKTIKKGIVRSATNASFTNLFSQSTIEQGIYLLPLSTTLKIYDSESGTTITTTNIPTHYFDSGTNRIFRFSVVPSTLNIIDPITSTTYKFEVGDSVWLEATYVVSGNIGGISKEVLIDNDFFLSNDPNAWISLTNSWSCSPYNAKFTLVGYSYTNSWATNYSVTSCSKIIQQNFWFNLGGLYQGGNAFPYEYRNWAHIKEAEVTIPANYEILNIYFKQRRTTNTNGSTTQTVNNITPYYNNGTVLKFDLQQHYTANSGTVEYSDDGFSGTIYLELAPTCDVPVNTYENIVWRFNFQKSTFLGAGQSGWITAASNDQIKFNPTNLTLSSTNPYLDGLSRTVQWHLNVKNNTGNSNASNTWLHLKNPSQTIDIVAVIDELGDTLQQVGDIYQLGTINTYNSRDLYIVGKYSSCTPQHIVAYAGYECAAYPNLFTNFSCPYTTYGLYVEPKLAAQQARISGKTIGGNCSNTLELNINLSSVKFGYLDSIKILVEPIGQSLQYIVSSAELDYPQNGAFATITDPSTVASGYLFNLSSANNSLTSDGLPGVLSVPDNKLQLRFRLAIQNSFQPGDYVKITLSSQRICGNAIPDIVLAYDPSIAMSKNTAAGISGDFSNTWGVAWVDYNNDGFEDVFLTEYDETKNNLLYKNNGNGTFTKVTSGDLVNDKENSVSSTWADYDNDGDVDVFLVNNTFGENKLYTNNGNGTFTRGSSGNINNYGGYCHNATWVDYDNDGFLDLFVSDFMPTHFNKLYHSNGDGTFSEVVNQIITNEAHYSIGTTWADYDNDGDLDAFIPNTWDEKNLLYRNNSNGQFEKIIIGDIAQDTGKSVGCSWGDYNNDGFLDLFVANTGNQVDFLYKNNGDGTFLKITTGPVVTIASNSSGSSWVDIDNDGDLDLFVSADNSSSSRLFINDGNGNFSINDNPINDNHGNSYPNAWADYDNDGDLDLFIGNRNNEVNVFFTNDKAACNNWFCAKLEGSVSNKSAIGAKVRVKATINNVSVWQLREISSQTGGGAGSQNTLKAMFGMGNATLIDSVIVEWPSGIKQYFVNQPVNGCNDIIEPNGNYICGSVFYDVNADCTQGVSEVGIPNTQLVIMPGAHYITTDDAGNFNLYLPNGVYTLSQQLASPWSQLCPSSNTSISFTVNNNSVCGLSFANTTSCSLPDLTVSLGATALRRGFRNQISLTYENISPAEAQNVEVFLELNNNIIPVDASRLWNSTTVVNDSTTSYKWSIGTVAGFSTANIQVTDSVGLLAILGNFTQLKASISTTNSECGTGNNSIVFMDEFVGSVDPNDKQVFPRKQEGIQQVTANQRLEYTIRFQNVGNYYASLVLVVDTLSPYLDVSTIKIEAMSHNFETTIEGNILKWYATNLYLPDTTENIVESQGFIRFSILPNNTAMHDVFIYNNAAITFDYNHPIITNTVKTKLINKNAISQQKLVVSAFPNPTTNAINITAKATDNNYVLIQKVEILSLTGKHLRTYFYNFTDQINLSLTEFGRGIYQVVILDEFGRTATLKVVKI